jgi:hypothetical protein
MHALPPVDWLRPNFIYTLANPITAFATSADEQDTDRSGPICEIPEGADLTVCGGGFSKRTVRVHYGDCHYCVFWRDLAFASRRAQMKSAARPMALLRLAEVVGTQDQAAYQWRMFRSWWRFASTCEPFPECRK